MQKALWGQISPDIRAIALGWGSHSISARFIYDHPVGPDEWDTVRLVEGYMRDEFDTDLSATDFLPVFDLGPFTFLQDETWWA